MAILKYYFFIGLFSLPLIGFGFVIERFVLFVTILMPKHNTPLQSGLSFWIGLAFEGLGAVVAAYSTVQYRKLLFNLKPIETPTGYPTFPGVITNLLAAVLGIVLTVYFIEGV